MEAMDWSVITGDINADYATLVHEMKKAIDRSSEQIPSSRITRIRNDTIVRWLFEPKYYRDEKGNWKRIQEVVQKDMGKVAGQLDNYRVLGLSEMLENRKSF